MFFMALSIFMVHGASAKELPKTYVLAEQRAGEVEVIARETGQKSTATRKVGA
jgi:hypothetical protein